MPRIAVVYSRTPRKKQEYEAKSICTFMLLGILFNVCLIAANLLETKVIQVFGITVTAGLLVFPVSYIINDCIAEVWGFRKARLIIWSGFAMNFFVVMLGLIAVPCLPLLFGKERLISTSFSAWRRVLSLQAVGISGRFVSQRLCDEPHESGERRASFFGTRHLVYGGGRDSRFADILSGSLWRHYRMAGIAGDDVHSDCTEIPV